MVEIRLSEYLYKVNADKAHFELEDGRTVTAYEDMHVLGYEDIGIVNICAIVENRAITLLKKVYPEAQSFLQSIGQTGFRYTAEGESWGVLEDSKIPDVQDMFFKSDDSLDGDLFSTITHKLAELHSAKNADYGDIFHELFKEHGVIVGYIHLKEKLQRIKSLMESEAKVKGERMEDSLMDLASYAIMTLVELRETKCKY